MEYKSVRTLILLSFLFIAISMGAALFQGPTYDEPAVLAAGLSYWSTGQHRLYLDDPPLIKLMAALPLYLYGIPFPESPADWETSRAFLFGERLLYGNTASSDFILNLGRAGVLILTGLLPLSVYLCTKQIAGHPAAAAAAFSITFLPPLLGHAPLIKTDVFFAALFLPVFLSFKTLLEKGAWYCALWAGIFLGLALSTKFSAITLLPILCVHAIIERDKLQRWTAIQRVKNGALYLLAAGTVLMGLSFLQPQSLWKGLVFIIQDALKGRPSFLMGEYSRSGWLLYFPLAFLWKTPPPFMLACVISLFLLIKNRLISNSLSLRKELLIWVLLPMSIFFIIACSSKTHIGLRHVFPLYPCLALLIGVAFHSASRKWARRGWLALGLWAVVETAVAFPHYIAYFNLLIGGPSQGHRYLVDSNCDWGQAIRETGKWFKKSGVEGIYLSYFGNADPHAYGIRYVQLPSMGEVSRAGDDIDLRKQKRAYLAISATNLRQTYAIDKNLWKWLWPMTPVATPGYAILIYDITEDAQAHHSLARIFERGGNLRKARMERIWAENLEKYKLTPRPGKKDGKDRSDY